MFTEKQIAFLRSLCIHFNFDNLTDNELEQIEVVVSDKLVREGFDGYYNPNAIGLMCESILDKLAEL